jgi:uncharacterized membrane protein (DUF2068 family)
MLGHGNMILSMERPTGVTILAYLYFVAALSVFVALIPGYHQTFDATLQRPRLIALSLGSLVICLALGIGLLRMKNWSRWLAIVLNATNLLFVPHAIARRNGAVAIIQAGLGTLLFVWVICYLTRPRVKMAFRSA